MTVAEVKEKKLWGVAKKSHEAALKREQEKALQPPPVIPEWDTTWDDTLKVIPDGVQTMSKMPSRHIEPLYPKYINRGKGAYVYAGDKKYIDYPCGLGAILLGYSDDRVNEAVKKQLAKGSLFSLPNKLETKLAEKLVEIIPCAEQVRFLKTGSEATSAAVKIARASTGKDGVICCGYHGWHSWYSVTTDHKKGVPTAYSKLAGQCPYGDKDMVREMFSLSNVVEKEVGAFILEPYVYEGSVDFLRWLVSYVHDCGALIIFDEVVTGFRSKELSAQKMYEVTPDLACFGKALGNGIPISFVCGQKKYMAEVQGDCFVSSTFGGDLLGIAAALAVIEILQTEPVVEHIWEMGQRLKDGYNEMTEDLKGTKLIGLPCRTFFEMPSELHKSLLWQECIKRGVLFGYAQFINYSHKEQEINRTLEVLGDAVDVLRKHWGNPTEGLGVGVKPASATKRHR